MPIRVGSSPIGAIFISFAPVVEMGTIEHLIFQGLFIFEPDPQQ
jgi:hypothetical protein